MECQWIAQFHGHRSGIYGLNQKSLNLNLLGPLVLQRRPICMWWSVHSQFTPSCMQHWRSPITITPMKREIQKSLIVSLILKFLKRVCFHWNFLHLVVNLIPHSLSLVPCWAGRLKKIDNRNEIFKCLLLTKGFELEDGLWRTVNIKRHR
jgi:hypothetical protein